MQQTNASERASARVVRAPFVLTLTKLKRLPLRASGTGKIRNLTSRATLEIDCDPATSKERGARVTHLRQSPHGYGLIIISDNPFHYADDQRGHVIRLPTGMPVDGSNGKREVTDEKKK